MRRLVVASLRRSPARRVLRTPRTAAPAVGPASQIVLVVRTTSRAIHSTRPRLDADADSEASRDSDSIDYGQSALAFAAHLAPFLLVVGIYDYYFSSPDRLRPSVLMNESFELVSHNAHVASRLGTGLFAYGDLNEFGDDVDHGRVVGTTAISDDRISHAETVEKIRFMDPDSIVPSEKTRNALHLQIKYNIKGKDGQRAVVFARVRDDMTKNQYEYLIVEFVETGEVLEIIDNREVLATRWEPQPLLTPDGLGSDAEHIDSKAILWI